MSYSMLTILLGFFLITLDVIMIPGGIVGTCGILLIFLAIAYVYKKYGADAGLHTSLATIIVGSVVFWYTINYTLMSVDEKNKTHFNTLIDRGRMQLNNLTPFLPYFSLCLTC